MLSCCCNIEPSSDSGKHYDLNDEHDHQEQDKSDNDTPPDTPTRTGERGGIQFFSPVTMVVGAIKEQAGLVVENIEDKVTQAVHNVSAGVTEALHLDEKFKTMADNVLDQIAPKAGEMTIDEAQNFIPAFNRLDKATSRDLDGEATEACTSKILGYRQKIHDFCEDVSEDVIDCLDGTDPAAGILRCLYKVVSWIMRACKEGVQTAVELLKKVIPDCIEPCCFSCLGFEGKLAKWVTSTFNKVVDMLEGIIQEAMRSVGVPDFICDKVDFNGNASADNAQDDDEPVKVRQARETAIEAAPVQVAPVQVSLETEDELGQV